MVQMANLGGGQIIPWSGVGGGLRAVSDSVDVTCEIGQKLRNGKESFLTAGCTIAGAGVGGTCGLLAANAICEKRPGMDDGSKRAVKVLLTAACAIVGACLGLKLAP